MLYDYHIKFKGKRLDNGEIVVGDLIRKTSRFGVNIIIFMLMTHVI